MSKSNLCCHRLTIAIACRINRDFLPFHASIVTSAKTLNSPNTPVGSGLGGRGQAKRSPRDSAKSRAEKRRERSAPRAPPKIPSPKNASQ
ncbi:hypothetical protein AVEN_233308-1 [Araneus ventricosus]|uniref:Uncharacterized protein n=1 Tax=Araneus ventricosus TaxID=182803 RepID=A0A4Y2AQB2_ARAVE|nr:hypothetical protein AVEN_233308-1 [Araneus ventricosus]